MLLVHINRGNLISFSVVFYDNADAVTSPDSANLYISYINSDGDRTTDTIAMDQNTDDWSAEWDSSVAKKGRVHWSVRSVDPSSADDGQFELEANLANPDPESA